MAHTANVGLILEKSLDAYEQRLKSKQEARPVPKILIQKSHPFTCCRIVLLAVSNIILRLYGA